MGYKFITLLLPLLGLPMSTSQNILGTDICVCSPGSIEFTFDFSLLCPPANVTIGGGIEASTCIITGTSGPEPAVKSPVVVNSVSILELDPDSNVKVVETIERDFANGDTFTYTSQAVTSTDNALQAISLTMIGINEFEEGLFSTFLIKFTNNCQSYPVLFEGNHGAWARMTTVDPPLQTDLCPISQGPMTPAPSVAPIETDFPTSMSMSMSMSMDLMFFDEQFGASEFGVTVLASTGKGRKGSKKGSKKSAKRDGSKGSTSKKTKLGSQFDNISKSSSPRKTKLGAQYYFISDSTK